VHMNVRFFIANPVAGDTAGQPVWWFGGGMDLTPYYGFEADAVHFHRTCSDAPARKFACSICEAGCPRRGSRSCALPRNDQPRCSRTALRSTSTTERTLASHSASATICSRASCHGTCAVERWNESGGSDRPR
jgi:hypothetical protein